MAKQTLSASVANEVRRALDELAKEAGQTLASFAGDILDAAAFPKQNRKTKNMFTVLEASQILGVSKQTIRNEVRRGRLGATRIGNQFIVSFPELVEYVGSETKARGFLEAWE